jgi:uncharacterized protein YggE
MSVRLLNKILVLIGLLSLALPLSAQERQPLTRTITLIGITLIGTGEVKAKPDMAVVTVGVTKRAATAREALTENNTAMLAIIDLLKQLGIEEKDIQTSGFSVSPAYQYDNQNQQPPKIIGYDVSNQLAVIVRKLQDLGNILDQVVSKGSNQVYGIGFSIADPRPLEDAARRLAITDVTRKARLYAESAGISLGQIVSILEHVQPPPVPLYGKVQRMEAAQDASVPVAEGQQVISAHVNVSWEIR